MVGRGGVSDDVDRSGVGLEMYVLCREFTVERGDEKRPCDVFGRVGVIGDAPRDAWSAAGVIGRLFFLRRFWGRLPLIYVSYCHS